MYTRYQFFVYNDVNGLMFGRASKSTVACSERIRQDENQHCPPLRETISINKKRPTVPVWHTLTVTTQGLSGVTTAKMRSAFYSSTLLGIPWCDCTI